MNEINFDERMNYAINGGVFDKLTLVVDATECPINCPSDSKKTRKLFFSGRNKDNSYGRYNVKYTIACNALNGKIHWFCGPVPSSVHDITQLKKSDFFEKLSLDEKIMGDKGYIGIFRMMTPYKEYDNGNLFTPLMSARNKVIASTRQIVECVIRRIKIFGVLGNRGRFRNRRDFHKAVFEVCCQLTNITIDVRPVFKGPTKYIDV
jgi:hypothetical protein